jgi:hypothetical protein
MSGLPNLSSLSLVETEGEFEKLIKKRKEAAKKAAREAAKAVADAASKAARGTKKTKPRAADGPQQPSQPSQPKQPKRPIPDWDEVEEMPQNPVPKMTSDEFWKQKLEAAQKPPDRPKPQPGSPFEHDPRNYDSPPREELPPKMRQSFWDNFFRELAAKATKQEAEKARREKAEQDAKAEVERAQNSAGVKTMEQKRLEERERRQRENAAVPGVRGPEAEDLEREMRDYPFALPAAANRVTAY